MKVFFTSMLTLVIAFSSVSAKKNPYMSFGTDEYKNVTQKVLGIWNASSYNRSDRGEQMSTVYKKATIELAGMKKDGKRGKVIYKFYLSDSLVDVRSKDDKAQDPTLKVDNYIVVMNGQWDIYDKEPNVIRFQNDSEPYFEITGSGNTINDFAKGQNGLLSGSSALGNISGPAGFIASKAAKAGTGLSDITPELPYKVEFVLDGDNNIDLKGNSELTFKAAK
jgi:hypothetical protein